MTLPPADGVVKRILTQQHPDYALGFYEACDFTPLHYGMTPEYRSGWMAAHRAKRMLRTLESVNPQPPRG